MPYQAILFDLDDTLISLRGCEAQALQRTLAEAGLMERLPADYGSVSATFAEISGRYWGHRSGKGYSRDEILEHSLRDLFAYYELDAAQSAPMAIKYWSAFCRSAALNPGALETLNRLSQHFRLGVITNGYIDSQRGRLEAAGLTDYFDPILISEEVGVAKPDRRIFEMALAQLDMRREDVLYVGDSIGHDHEGCISAGIDFCHYCPQSAMDLELPAVKFTIGRLSELIDLLSPRA